MDVRFIISVDSTGAITSVQAFDGSIQKLAKTGSGASSVLGGIWKQFTIGSLAASAVHKGIAAVRETIADTIKVGREFEREWANTTTMMDVSADETARMKDEFMKLSPHLGDTTMLARGMYEVLSASVEPAKAIQFLGEAAKSAKAGLTDTFTAVDALTTVINAYGKEAEQATEVSDVMFKAVKLGKMTYEQMAGALGTVVPIASQVGISFEEVAAAMSSLTRKGIDANTTTVQLRQILVSALKPTKEASDLAKQLGLDFSATALASKGLSGFLQDVMDKTNGSADALTILFGNVRALTGIMGLAAEGASDFKADLEAMKTASGSTQEAFAKQMQSVDFWIDSFSVSMDKMKLSFYDGFVTPIRNSIDSAEKLDGMVADLQTAVQGLGETIGTFALPVFGEMISKLNDWAAVLKTLPVYVGMLQQLMRGEPVNLDRAIDKYISIQIATGKWATKTKEVRTEIQGLTDVIDRARTYYADQAAMILEGATSAEEASRQIDNLKKYMRSGEQAAVDMGGGIADLKKELDLTFRSDIETRIAQLNDALLRHGGQMTHEGIKKVREEINELNQELKGLKPTAKSTEDVIKDLLEGLVDDSADAADDFAGFFKEGFDDIKKAGERALEKDLPSWLKDLPKAAEKSTDKMTAAFEKYGGAVRDIIGSIDGIINQSYSNQSIELDNFYQDKLEKTKAEAETEQALADAAYEAEKARIQASKMSEEEKTAALTALEIQYNANKQVLATDTNAAIEGIESEYTMKSRELRKKQAEAGKVTAIASAIMNVAEGVTKAIAQGGIFGIIYGAIVSALGIIQIAKIRSTPIPLATGAIFRKPVFSAGGGYMAGDVEEAAIPLRELPRMMRRIMAEDRRANGPMGGRGEDIYIRNEIILDSRKMAEFTKKAVQKKGALGKLGLVGRGLGNG